MWWYDRLTSFNLQSIVDFYVSSLPKFQISGFSFCLMKDILVFMSCCQISNSDCLPKSLNKNNDLFFLPAKRGFHSTEAKRMGGHGHDEPYYLHAKHMYNLDRMKHQKLTMSLAVFTAFSIGVAVPIYAVIFQQSKTASGWVSCFLTAIRLSSIPVIWLGFFFCLEIVTLPFVPSLKWMTVFHENYMAVDHSTYFCWSHYVDVFITHHFH